MCEDYIEVYMPTHHRAKTNGCVDIHILEAEKNVGETTETTRGRSS